MHVSLPNHLNKFWVRHARHRLGKIPKPVLTGLALARNLRELVLPALAREGAVETDVTLFIFHSNRSSM